MADSFTPILATNSTSMVFTSEGVIAALECSLLILFIILIPYLIELYLAYSTARKRDERAQELLRSTTSDFIASLKFQGALSEEQLNKLYERVFTPIQETLKQPVAGISGSTRGIIAFAIIYTVSVATMLVLFAKSGDSTLVNNVVSMLAATLATIVGFYFGGRTVQETAAATAETVRAQTATSPGPARLNSRSEEPKKAIPVLKVNGIAVAPIRKIEDGITHPLPGLNIYDTWTTFGKKSIEVSMSQNNEKTLTEYTLYCNVESSVPQGEYDIYIEPLVKKGSEIRPFLDHLREDYTPMIPHLTVNKWYVQFFDWIPKYKNWREPGEYQVILNLGYLKKGTQGKEPIWIVKEELTVKITS